MAFFWARLGEAYGSSGGFRGIYALQNCIKGWVGNISEPPADGKAMKVCCMKNKIHEILAGWWFQIYVLFSPLFGEDFQFDEYFSDGLKPPTRDFKTLSTRFFKP